jgi:6-pyruvoyltetrahydropterin/6-carboxytetrahydropterin synthase
MYRVSIEIGFDAAHRLLGYPGKCAQPHGHSYRAVVTAARAELDETGLVIDFADLKAGLKTWIDHHWDHGFLLNDRDEVLLRALRSVPESKLYLFHDVNPTAEAIARELYEVARQQFGDVIHDVRIWETPTASACYIPGNET